jgi:hypothetical protein
MKLVSILGLVFCFISLSFSQTVFSQFYGVNGGSSAGTVRAVATAGNTLFIGGTFTEVNLRDVQSVSSHYQRRYQ